MMRNAYIILVKEPERNRPLGRPKCHVEDNIKMNLQQIEFDDMDRIYLALLHSVMNIRFP
jgi:hypothetical protein